MTWLQLSVAVGRDQVDRADAVLQAGGAHAVSLSAAGEEVLLEPLPGQQPLWHQVRLEALLEPDADLSALRAELAPLGARLVDVQFVAPEDWQQRWRAHAVRACFGGRLWVLPRDEPFAPPAGGKAGAAGSAVAVLRLDPGLAFGSGSHPTTRLCLAGLAAQPLAGRDVLDFGCGSGILALAACLLGARRVVAVDHDPQALLATRDNAAYNDIDERTLTVLTPEALLGPDQPLWQFDVVVANILARPLIDLAPALCAVTAPGGLLMLSGLLAEQADMVRAAYPEVRFDAPAHEEEWIRLDGRR
ncbi:MAG: 50S ribosomal protein L11 methyltransferase [Pseudomonadales bacterium]